MRDTASSVAEAPAVLDAPALLPCPLCFSCRDGPSRPPQRRQHAITVDTDQRAHRPGAPTPVHLDRSLFSPSGRLIDRTHRPTTPLVCRAPRLALPPSLAPLRARARGRRARRMEYSEEDPKPLVRDTSRRPTERKGFDLRFGSVQRLPPASSRPPQHTHHHHRAPTQIEESCRMRCLKEFHAYKVKPAAAAVVVAVAVAARVPARALNPSSPVSIPCTHHRSAPSASRATRRATRTARGGTTTTTGAWTSARHPRSLRRSSRRAPSSPRAFSSNENL